MLLFIDNERVIFIGFQGVDPNQFHFTKALFFMLYLL